MEPRLEHMRRMLLLASLVSPISPCISMYLLTSPYISLHLACCCSPRWLSRARARARTRTRTLAPTRALTLALNPSPNPNQLRTDPECVGKCVGTRTQHARCKQMRTVYAPRVHNVHMRMHTHLPCPLHLQVRGGRDARSQRRARRGARVHAKPRGRGQARAVRAVRARAAVRRRAGDRGPPR